MLVAETVCALRKDARQELRAATYVVSALANNLPDIDIVYTWITGPKPLGSLLHHRGHTHTLLVALPCAWLLQRVVLAIYRRRQQFFSAAEARLLLWLALAGPLLHLTMDYGNNYGVHPFWPLTGRWFYGDTIFIVEPLWWAVTIPVLAAALTRRWLKIVLWVLLSAVLIVCWFVPFVHTGSRFALLGLTAAAYALARWGSPRTRALGAVGGALLVAAAFRVGSASAKVRLGNALEASFPALMVHDIAATPMPANPACWEGLAVGEQGGRYLVIRSSIALPPLGAADCTAGVDVRPTAHVEQLQRHDRNGVRFRTRYSAELGQLRALRDQDCRFRALLEFYRVPYVQAAPGAGLAPARLYTGDARYDRAPDLDFSDAELPLDPASGPCPRFVPGWSEPRGELFRR